MTITGNFWGVFYFTLNYFYFFFPDNKPITKTYSLKKRAMDIP